MFKTIQAPPIMGAHLPNFLRKPFWSFSSDILLFSVKNLSLSSRSRKKWLALSQSSANQYLEDSSDLENLFMPSISAIFPVNAKYPIAPINTPKAISFGAIPSMIQASPNPKKVITAKTLVQLSAEFMKRSGYLFLLIR